MTLRVHEPSPEVTAMAVDWAVCEALMGGTKAMRAAGETLMPRWPAEDQQAWAARLKVATLFPAYRRTVGVMSGKPFSKALTFSDDVPARIRELCDDVDLQGRNLHAFSADAFMRTIGYGWAGIHVDYPKADGVTNLAEERAMGARPYFRLIRHSQILGWKLSGEGAAVRLTQLRLAEVQEVSDGGRFGVKCIRRVRVLEPGRWEVWQEPEKEGDEYVLIDEGTTVPMTEIPFVPLYGFREAFMIGRPPLMDLAHLNVKHWQSQSDQDNISHVARVPILAATGIDDPAWALTVGAQSAVKLPAGATLEYVEHTGAAISAGRESLQDLEQQMIQTGAELLVKKPGDRSATEAANDADGNKSDLQRIAETFEDALDAALQFMAGWIGEQTGGHVSLYKDFGAMSLGQASGQLVLSMQQGGLISKGTAIREMQRRGELDAGIEPDEELGLVNDDGPALGTMGDPNADPGSDPSSDQPGPGDQQDAGGASARTGAPSPAPAPGAPAPSPAPSPAAPPPSVDLTELANILAAALAKLPAPVVNMPPAPAMPAMPPITIESPITVNVPEQPPAQVTVEGSTVNVAPPAVTVEGSTVNVAPPAVSVPVQVTVEKGGQVQFTEDAAGNITGARME